jgi:hypothetical protein
MNRSPELGTEWSPSPRPVPAGQKAWSPPVPERKKGDHCRPPDVVRGGVALSRTTHTTINSKTVCKSKLHTQAAAT